MKKLNKTSDANVEFLESTRRLYRGATEIAKKLDEKKNSASSILDIFTIENEVLRGKLKDYCERLLFKDPIGHAKKIEELLWRRGFYDAVSTAKKIVKTNEWSKIEKSLLLTHLSVGVGFYHHLILRIHLENKLDLAGFIDFAYPQNDCYYVENIKIQKQNQDQEQQDDKQLKECLMKIVHRSLVCLGDLARYKLEFDANWDPMIAMRYYKMAITIEPNYGMPHNQLGTLAANKNYGIDAVYYYLRSTLCTLPFEGAEGNLNRIINTNNNNNKLPIAPSKICANLLFNLIKKWYNNDTPTTSKNIIVDTNTNDTCQILLDNIENLLKIDKLNDDNNNNNLSEQATSIDKFLKNLKSQDLPYLSDNVVFKIVSICLMLISKLKKNNSSQLNQVIAFMLSVLSKLLQVAVCRLEMSIDKLSLSSTTSDVLINNNHEKLKIKNEESINDNENLIINKKNNKNGHVKNRVKSKSLLSKLRRPKKRVNSLDSDSSDIDEFDDDDDDEIISNDNTSSDEYNSEKDVNSDESEQEIDESSQDDDSNNSTDSNDDDDDDDDNNIENNCIVNDEITINNKILMILTNEGLLQSIKICFNWLQDNQDIIKLAFKGSQLLLKRITIFFNLINININKIMKNKNIFNDESMIFSNNQDESILNNYIKIIPLPEDIDLQGLNILNASHNNIDWKILKTLNINNQEESLLRCLKIINFANYLCTIDESGLKYNDTNGYFYIDDLNKPNDNDECSTSKSTVIVNDNDNLIINNNSKGKLMRHMGELWLKAEVKALENRLKSKLMSAYLVPDHDALAKYTPLLKRLVYTKKFIIVIPSIVVSALDELKRTSGHAREATRWLEGQLKKGSRFLRAQRPQENLPLAYIKGPRPKDKEAWVFFQIIECCHYLQKQTKIDNDSNEPPVVTLLTGITRKSSPSSSLSFSPDALAQNAGINLEHIESFHTKWKTSSKSHG